MLLKTLFLCSQRIKDRLLILGVASLVAVDLVILVTYTLVEAFRGKFIAQEVSNKEQPMEAEQVRRIAV